MTPEERILIYERHMECQRRELATVYDEAVKMGLVEPCGSCGHSRIPPFFVLTKKIKDAMAQWKAIRGASEPEAPQPPKTQKSG